MNNVSKLGKFALFIGRWQPPHNGHMHIIKEALDAGKSVAIGFRDTPISGSDPYTVEERMVMFRAIFDEMNLDTDRYFFVPMPDIESVNIGRKVGYDVIRYDVPADIAGISATAIRKGMAENDDSWKERVPNAVAEYLTPKAVPLGHITWLTGLPCSGKTTIAAAIRKSGVTHIDGDEMRKGLCSDLGFSKEDRDENLRRIAHLASSLANVGQTVVCSFVSPMKSQRDMVKEIIGAERFRLVFVDCPVETCIERDVKGMYAKAQAGEIPDFTGVQAPYEQPDADEADLIIHTNEECVGDSADRVFQLIQQETVGG